MAPLKESIDIGCPVYVTQDDLRTCFFRRALGEYAAPAEQRAPADSAGKN
jgi:hypothetical protein